MQDHRGNVLIPMDEKVQKVMTDLHRGILPDLEMLTVQDREKVIVALDAESKMETTYKFPVREASRKNLRSLLAAKVVPVSPKTGVVK